MDDNVLSQHYEDNISQKIPLLLQNISLKSKINDQVKLSKWEILGPLPIGKLEVDG